MAYHLALPQVRKEIFMKHFGCSYPALPQQVRELHGQPEFFSSHSLGWRLVCAPFRCVILKIYYPFWFLPSHLHSWLLASPFYLSVVIFASPLGCAGSVTSVVNFLNHGLVAFQPSVTSEDFSAQHFLLFRVLMGQEQAGHEQADVCTAELLVVGALPTPSLQPGGCLAWWAAHFYT